MKSTIIGKFLLRFNKLMVDMNWDTLIQSSNVIGNGNNRRKYITYFTIIEMYKWEGIEYEISAEIIWDGLNWGVVWAFKEDWMYN